MVDVYGVIGRLFGTLVFVVTGVGCHIVAAGWYLVVRLDDIDEEVVRVYRTRDFRVDSYPTILNPDHIPGKFLAEREARVEAHRRRVELECCR